ncbi:MAG: signal recognition particle-docking protein FtsY [Candidatus Aenigmarchaeota archaeon]|nr:signal recognition particle-docking protein FtsY [Candidatus Aenigmarchaeota archaeon]
MFDFLKKKLSESVKKLARKAEEKEETQALEAVEAKADEEIIEAEVEERHEQEPPAVLKGVHREIEEGAEPETRAVKKPKKGLISRITERQLSGQDVDSFFNESESGLLEANIALEVADFLRGKLKEELARKSVGRFKAEEAIKEALESSLLAVLDQGRINLEEAIRQKRKEGKPLTMVFLGFNGSGKTTSIAKIAHHLKKHGFSPVMAAGDTFRAASIEQLEHHGKKVGVRVVKHDYGADSAAVIFDAIKSAESRRNDVVLADTAGRTHVDANLLDELKKVIRVNKPDLKVLVIDSITGNDAVEQARRFNESIGVDAVVLTKVDVNPKGGAIFSVCYAIKKPILFLGTGQEYEDIERFEPRKFVKGLFE